MELGIKKKTTEIEKNKVKRLFIAIPIHDDAKKLLLAKRDLVQQKEKYRWEKPEKIHLTLNFIGDVEEEKIPIIEKVLDEVMRFKTFLCNITQFDFFFNEKEPKVLFAKLEVDKSIFEIERFISERLKNFDILADTKPFKPHITLLRLKRKTEKGFIDAFKRLQFEKISFNADTIALYESLFTRSGSIYKRLKTIHLFN